MYKIEILGLIKERMIFGNQIEKYVIAAIKSGDRWREFDDAEMTFRILRAIVGPRDAADWRRCQMDSWNRNRVLEIEHLIADAISRSRASCSRN